MTYGLSLGMGVRKPGQPKDAAGERKAECCKKRCLVVEVMLWGTGEVRDFAASDTSETNPTNLNYTVASRYEDSDQNKPKPVILLVISCLRRKRGRFSGTLNAEHD